MSTMSVSEARAALPDVLDRVLAGEEVTITRHGRAVAVVVRPDTMRVRRADEALAQAERITERLRRAAEVPLSASPALSERRADELILDLARNRAPR